MQTRPNNETFFNELFAFGIADIGFKMYEKDKNLPEVLSYSGENFVILLNNSLKLPRLFNQYKTLKDKDDLRQISDNLINVISEYIQKKGDTPLEYIRELFFLALHFVCKNTGKLTDSGVLKKDPNALNKLTSIVFTTKMNEQFEPLDILSSFNKHIPNILKADDTEVYWQIRSIKNIDMPILEDSVKLYKKHKELCKKYEKQFKLPSQEEPPEEKSIVALK